MIKPNSGLIQTWSMCSCLSCIKTPVKFKIHLNREIFTWYYFLELSGRRLETCQAMLGLFWAISPANEFLVFFCWESKVGTSTLKEVAERQLEGNLRALYTQYFCFDPELRHTTPQSKVIGSAAKNYQQPQSSPNPRKKEGNQHNWWKMAQLPCSICCVSPTHRSLPWSGSARDPNLQEMWQFRPNVIRCNLTKNYLKSLHLGRIYSVHNYWICATQLESWKSASNFFCRFLNQSDGKSWEIPRGFARSEVTANSKEM